MREDSFHYEEIQNLFCEKRSQYIDLLGKTLHNEINETFLEDLKSQKKLYEQIN